MVNFCSLTLFEMWRAGFSSGAQDILNPISSEPYAEHQFQAGCNATAKKLANAILNITCGRKSIRLMYLLLNINVATSICYSCRIRNALLTSDGFRICRRTVVCLAYYDCKNNSEKYDTSTSLFSLHSFCYKMTHWLHIHS